MLSGIGSGGSGGFIRLNTPAADVGSFAALTPMRSAEMSSGSKILASEANLTTNMQNETLGYQMTDDGLAQVKKGSFASKAV